jgi:hypothetical protein
MTGPTTTAPCRGGPLDGEEVTLNDPAGLLLIDQPAGRVWKYVRDFGHFPCREPEGVPVTEPELAALLVEGWNLRYVDQG